MVADVRQQEVKRQVKRSGKRISRLKSYLSSLPISQRRRAKKELKQAFELGLACKELDLIPREYPSQIVKDLTIDASVRRHILNTRRVYRDIDQMQEIVSDLFSE